MSAATAISREALRRGDLQVDGLRPEGSAGSFIDLAPEPVVRLQSELSLLLVAWLVEHSRLTLGGGAGRLAADCARRHTYPRIVADQAG